MEEGQGDGRGRGTRTKYPDELKMALVKRAMAGEDTGDLALETGIDRLMIAKWVRQVRGPTRPKYKTGNRLSLADKMKAVGVKAVDVTETSDTPTAKGDDPRLLQLKAKVEALEAELAEIKVERDMLKSTSVFYLTKDLKK